MPQPHRALSASSRLVRALVASRAALAAALARSDANGVTAASLARHVQAVIQGAFVLAKAEGGKDAAGIAREELGHLRRYLELLLRPRTTGEQR